MNTNALLSAANRIIGAVALLAVLSSPAWSSDRDDSAQACSQLASADFSAVQDAPTQIANAASAVATTAGRAVCDVQGYIAPNIGFYLRLPVSGWNGKFIEVGCGGACGDYFDFLCNTPLRRGYACIASDMGHKSTTTDYKWAYNNLQAEVDWSFRATHVVALAGKAVAARYYGRQPNRSYFWGCSTGGRQGMIEAQRFPGDFDGIIAGAPPFSETDTLMRMLWSYRSLLDAHREPILKEEDLQVLHHAALQACDKDDGVEDGVIGSPRSCRFDPRALLCKKDQTADCLTDTQVAAAQKVYSGPSASNGRKLSTGGFTVGSELGWLDNIESGGPHAVEALHYIGFLPDPGPARPAPDAFDFDKDPGRLGMMESLYGDTNPDLRKFKIAGGKLLVYHGWTDLGPSPLDSSDYYETVTKTMGGLKDTQEFFRLFLVPGMNHCTGGDGAFFIDYLTYMENWVEKGEAPQVLIGAHVPSLKRGYDGFIREFPLDPATPVGFTRPVYPYPLQARYRGAGNPNAAENFAPQSPRHDSSK